MRTLLSLAVSLPFLSATFSQSLGIGTAAPHPAAMPHIELLESTTKGLLTTGVYNFNSTVPDIGPGSRLMFYPGKGAFRAGVVTGDQWNNEHVGHLSTALGFNTVANYLGTALGYHATASGSAAIAIGQNSTASGFHSIVIGENNLAPGSNGIAMGNSTNASGILAIAIGTNTAATGTFATAIGKNSQAIGESSLATGHYTVSGGTHSTAIGSHTIAKGFASTTIGMYNDSVLTSNQSSVSTTTPLFIIGNGDSHTARSNAMVVQKNGNVGIGVIPGHKLHVSGNGVFTGTVTASCGVLVCSDTRYKKDITPLTLVMSKVLALQPICYQWDKTSFPDKGFDERKQIGFSAQELEHVFPEVVYTAADGYKTVDYAKLVPVLVEAIKEQQQQIHDQQIQLDLQRRQLEKLEEVIYTVKK